MHKNCLSLNVLIALFMLGAFSALAELKQNTDENTLWIEDGKEIKTGAGSGDYWNDAIKFTPLPDGGFSMEASGKVNSTGRYLPMSQDYPYVVFEITQVEKRPGYTAFGLPQLLGSNNATVGIGIVSQLQTGIFAVNTFENGKLGSKTPFFRINLFNCTLNFKYLKCVKVPEAYIEMLPKEPLKIGDKITFKVHLEKPAEDVSLRFFFGYTMPEIRINGEQSLQLKPENPDDNKTWIGTIDYKSIDFSIKKDNQDIPPGGMLVKAVILGSERNTPVWGTNNYPVKVK